MKLALVMLPKGGLHDLVVEVDSTKWPAVVLVNRRKLTRVLFMFLACAIGLVIASYWFPHNFAGSWNRPVVLPYLHAIAPLAATAPAKSAVRDWNHAVPLNRGDKVIVHPLFGHQPRIEQVQGAPNEMVVIRNGVAVQSIYILGADKYYVVAGPGHAHVVAANEITGVVHQEAN